MAADPRPGRFPPIRCWSPSLDEHIMKIKVDKPEKGRPADITWHDGTPRVAVLPLWRADPEPRQGPWTRDNDPWCCEDPD